MSSSSPTGQGWPPGSAPEPQAQPIGGVADDAEVLGDLDGRRTATGVARVDRPVDSEHLAHLSRQLRVDVGELRVFEILEPDTARLGGPYRRAGRLVRDSERDSPAHKP